jgi:hypothetical protein
MPRKRATKRKKSPAAIQAPEIQEAQPQAQRVTADNRLLVGIAVAGVLFFGLSRLWHRVESAPSSGNGAPSRDYGPEVKLQLAGKYKIAGPAFALKADAEGDLFVLTAAGITRYRPDGVATATIKPEGKAVWQNMAFDGKRFYVTAGKNTVRVVPKDLSRVENEFRVPGAKALFGIATGGHERLFVSDCTLHCVDILSQEGALLGKVGGKQGSGLFSFPMDVTCDDAGNLYILDFLAFRILRFGPEGALAATWPAPMNNAVAHDWERLGALGGKVYMDSFNDHRLIIEDQSGKDVGQCVELSDGSALDSPQMVGVGLDGRLYVYDSGSVYKLQALGADTSVPPTAVPAAALPATFTAKTAASTP